MSTELPNNNKNQNSAISGYVLVHGQKGWKRRWVLFQLLNKQLLGSNEHK